ncbi:MULTISPECIES: hypothetical protein [Bacillus cereus group]|nr:alpha/beta-type small acid-soluble spore protein [Bacillus thuringiensis]OTZ53694.1 hypothetical protein BK762_08940 [Bacillus thuringiensis serovar toumanoffi]PDX91070.1 hypothetical protein COM78_31275 [Bacillus thuringiensis]PFF27242.1 hypothetical protein CN335_29825 [Bacillus thuringiensis]PFT08417.1 hypothetical protein COK83_27190 [Bacillus thuringiensis]
MKYEIAQEFGVKLGGRFTH